MAGGRDQLGPLERVTRILLALEGSEPRGIETDALLEIADYGGDPKNHPRLLQREIQGLNAAGFDIRNAAPPGESAVYRVFARDNTLRKQFTPEQQTELARAALFAGDAQFSRSLGVDVGAPTAAPASRGGVADPTLDRIIHAAAHHCLIRFTYKQRRRVVHPHIVSAGVSGWYLVGNEDGDDVEKRFVTDRMSDVTIDGPDTASAPPPPRRTAIDPLSWQIDPSTDVVVETDLDHRRRVEEMLGAADDVSADPDGRTVRLTIPVTNRRAFRGRLYELGVRVRVLAPDDVRAEIIAELRRHADHDGAP